MTPYNNHIVLLETPEVMKVNERNFDVRKNSILVEQDHTSSKVCYVEAIRQELVLEVFNCKSPQYFSIALSFPRQGPGLQLITTEPLLFVRSVEHVFVELIFLAKWSVFQLVPRGTLHWHPSHRQCDTESDLWVRFHTCRKNIPCERLRHNQITPLRQDTTETVIRENAKLLRMNKL